jgi:hypothetical protein
MSGDFSINRFSIPKITSTGSQPAAASQKSSQPILPKTGNDEFVRSNPLGINYQAAASKAVDNIKGKSIAELTQGWNPGTIDALKKAPAEFPPIEGF